MKISTGLVPDQPRLSENGSWTLTFRTWEDTQEHPRGTPVSVMVLPFEPKIREHNESTPLYNAFDDIGSRDHYQIPEDAQVRKKEVPTHGVTILDYRWYNVTVPTKIGDFE
jgi:hypothetical protein